MAGNEPVTSPDQHKPTNVKAARIGGIFTIAVLLLMTFGGHQSWTEKWWLIGIAAIIAVLLIIDWVMRRTGLSSG